MSKKGRQLRQLKKQLNQVKKLEKRLKQKGITLTSTEETTEKVEKTKPEQLIDIKQRKRELERQLQGKTTTAEPTIRVNEPIKVTGKQLRKAIEQRKQRTVKPVTPKASTSEVTVKKQSKKSKEQELKLKEKQLRETIEKRRQKALENEAKKEKPQEQNKQEKPREPGERRDNTNRDSSFFADAVIGNFLWECSRFPNSAYPIVKQWIDRVINSRGKQSTAEMLQAGANAGLVLTYDIAYSDLLFGYLADMLTFLPDTTDWEIEEIMEQFESWEDII